MFFVEELNRKLIVENGLCFFKRNLMLLEVRYRLRLVPLELDHKYIVFITEFSVKSMLLDVT